MSNDEAADNTDEWFFKENEEGDWESEARNAVDYLQQTKSISLV